VRREESPEEKLERLHVRRLPPAPPAPPPNGEGDYGGLGAPLLDADRPKPRFRTLREFCAEYQPIAEVVAGVLISGSLYTLTATTGTGKTALMVTMALAGAAGRDLLGRRGKQGRYAFCTAENPDGVRMRFAVGAFRWNIDQATVDRDLLISDNRVRPEEICEYLAREARDHGPFTGIFIDTWQAFFDGRDANNPTEAVNFTKRFRPLTSLPGSPVVVIAAHPNKNASANDLIPSGGGSTLNEVDGNLALAMQPGGLIELGWQGKFRGYHFEPQLFRIEKLCSPDIVDIEGRQIAIPIMFPATAEDAEAREAAIANREIRLLKAIADNPGATMTELAAKADIPRGSLARAVARLAKESPKLIQEKLGKWTATKAGKQALEERDGVSVVSRDAERDAEP
jgi:AAA domain/Winged helix-turn-helix DNA-binding